MPTVTIEMRRYAPVLDVYPLGFNLVWLMIRLPTQPKKNVKAKRITFLLGVSSSSFCAHRSIKYEFSISSLFFNSQSRTLMDRIKARMLIMKIRVRTLMAKIKARMLIMRIRVRTLMARIKVKIQIVRIKA